MGRFCSGANCSAVKSGPPRWDCRSPRDHDRSELQHAVDLRQQRTTRTCRVSVAVVEPQRRLEIGVKKLATEVGREDEPSIRRVGRMYQRQPGMRIYILGDRHGLDI